MIKLITLISLLLFNVSCTADHYLNQDKKNKRHYSKNYTRKVFNNFKYTMPSESMQVGIPKSKKSVSQNYSSVESFDSSDYAVKSKDSDGNIIGDEEDFSDDASVAKIDNDNSNSDSAQKPYSGYFKIGEPYSIFGVSYTPQNYESFEESGTASWYGSEFHGKQTANGEIYNMGDITAAHPTLPLPSLIKATNLKNGKSTIVRVNDRGPFAKNRIIDFSERTAEILGFKDKGTTEVKIELLREETDALYKKLRIKNKNN